MKGLKYFGWTCLALCLFCFLMARIYNNWYNEETYKLLSLVFLLFSVLSTMLIRALKEIQEHLELKILMNK